MAPMQPPQDPEFDAYADELAREVRRAKRAGDVEPRVWITAYGMKQLALRGWRFRTIRRPHWRERNPRGPYARISIVVVPPETEGEGT